MQVQDRLPQVSWAHMRRDRAPAKPERKGIEQISWREGGRVVCAIYQRTAGNTATFGFGASSFFGAHATTPKASKTRAGMNRTDFMVGKLSAETQCATPLAFFSRCGRFCFGRAGLDHSRRANLDISLA